MHSIQELEHGLGAAFRSLIYANHTHGDQQQQEEEVEGVEVVVHVPYVLLKILSFLPLPDLYRMRGTSRLWRHLLSATHVWDALPMGSEARKSCPWILAVDPDRTFNVLHVHHHHDDDNKRARHRGHCTKKMQCDGHCGGGFGIIPSAFLISITRPPLLDQCAIDRAKISTLSGLKSSFEHGVIKHSSPRHDDGFRPDISVYSSVNPCTGSSSNSSSSSSVTKAL